MAFFKGLRRGLRFMRNHRIEAIYGQDPTQPGRGRRKKRYGDGSILANIACSDTKDELDYYEAQVEKHRLTMSQRTYRRCRAALGMARRRLGLEEE